MPEEKSSRKKAKPRKAKLNKSYNEINPEGESRSNLEDDLQFSSDDHFYDDDDDEDDDDWQDVDNEPGFTVTVNDPGFVVQAGDGRSVQIDAPNVIIPNQDEVIADEEEVDENYDPTFFLQSLPQQQTVIQFRFTKFRFHEKNPFFLFFSINLNKIRPLSPTRLISVPPSMLPLKVVRTSWLTSKMLRAKVCPKWNFSTGKF